MELFHEVIPTATATAALVNPTNPNAEIVSGSLQAAARKLGLELHVLKVSTERDIEASFASVAHLRAGGLVIVGDAFINTHGEQPHWRYAIGFPRFSKPEHSPLPVA